MGVTLVDAIRLWPTPNASDAEMVKHHAGKGPSLAMAAGQWKADRLTGGRLSPAWVETLLMGWPPGWTEPEGEALAEAPGAPHDAEMFARLTGERTRERRERLRCIGNGVVSAVARLTFAALLPDVLTLRGAA